MNPAYDIHNILSGYSGHGPEKKPPPQLSGFLVRGCNSKAVRKSSRYFRIYSHYPLDFSGRTELTLNTQWVTGFLKFYRKSWQIADLSKSEEVYEANYLCSHIINPCSGDIFLQSKRSCLCILKLFQVGNIEFSLIIGNKW